MAAPLQLEFLLSATDVAQLPETRAEVAVVGRSNVGKSSLLNLLARRKSLARVSKTPGRTQTLNCFAAGPEATVVDCPGYGYAVASKATRGSWQPMIERYLLERDELTMVMLLVDGEIGPTKLDTQMLDWLRANVLPHTVIATKHDKVRPSQRDKRKRELAARCMLEPADVVWVSATKDTGVDRLRDLVRLWLNLE
ncbi:MAG: GTP-binding protein [Actinomycetota bacterium]|nr:GTP-binding protein [Actinomycetota bacterium]